MSSAVLNTGNLAGKVVLITGASRGIGRAIALKLAKDKASIVIAAKTSEPHPKLPGTIHTVAKEVESLGGVALPCVVDIRDEEQVQKSVKATIDAFGRIDIVINNASAINLTGTKNIAMKQYDLIHSINGRGTFLVTKSCLPYLQSGSHVLTISPPLSLFPCWYEDHAAYTASKFNMSMYALAWAEEFKTLGIRVNCLWPSTPIYTAAVEAMAPHYVEKCRSDTIMGDAAYVILSGNKTGYFFIDEDVLKKAGVTDFDQYAYKKGAQIHKYGRYQESVHSSQYRMDGLPDVDDGK